MRLVSLIPSATEIVYALGLEDDLVGVSHDSNYPPRAQQKPIVSNTLIDDSQTSKEIDEEVKKREHDGRSLFHVDTETLLTLHPDIILTQELCSVCAPTFDEVHRSCKIKNDDSKIVSLEPTCLNDILQNIKDIGQLTNTEETANEFLEDLQERIDTVRNQPTLDETVVVIEWLDPIMTAGHWVPELIRLAGATPVLMNDGKSKPRQWTDIVEEDPDHIIVAPCGFDTERTKEEMHLLTRRDHWNRLKAVRHDNVHLINGDAYLTRSGPRIVDGLERIHAALKNY